MRTMRQRKASREIVRLFRQRLPVMKFKIGDFVTRRENVFDQRSPLMHGIVIACYSKHSKYSGFSPEVYDVEWVRPVQKIERGYLPHGLDKG